VTDDALRPIPVLPAKPQLLHHSIVFFIVHTCKLRPNFRLVTTSGWCRTYNVGLLTAVSGLRNISTKLRVGAAQYALFSPGSSQLMFIEPVSQLSNRVSAPATRKLKFCAERLGREIPSGRLN
jgi:hypothetical protein